MKKALISVLLFVLLTSLLLFLYERFIDQSYLDPKPSDPATIGGR